MRIRFGLIVPFASLLAASTPQAAAAQEPRLVGRLPDAARVQVDSILEAARADGLPVEPLVDRALEGAAKGASGGAIVAAVRRLENELRIAREAFGEAASDAALVAGASALRAGATRDDLARLRTLRPEQPLTIPAAVLADLLAAGVPADMGVAAVIALAPTARDADYVAFRRNVERDIALGASPAASVGVRLRAMSEQALDAAAPQSGSWTRSPPRKRKP